MTNKTSQIIFYKNQHITYNSHDKVSIEQKPLTALRYPFNQWIRAMPMEERFLAVKIHAPEIYQSIRSIFTKQQSSSSQRNSEQKSENLIDSKKGYRKIQKILLDSLVFVSDGHEFLDHICFQYSLLECPERLFDLLINTTENISLLSLESILEHRKNPKTLSFIFEKINNKQKICQQLMQFLRQEIMGRFKEHKTIYESIQRNLQQEKRRKKQFSNHWKFLNQQMRYKLLLLGYKDINFLQDFLEQNQISIKINQLERDIDDLLKLEKNQFCNRIFKCKFKRIFHPLINYYQLIYKYWKKQVDKYKKKKIIKNNRPDRDYNSHNKTQNKQYYKHINSKRYKKNRKSNSLQSNETNETENSTNYFSKNQIDKENQDNYFDQFEKQYTKDEFRQKQKNIHNFQKERDKSKQQKIEKYLESEEEELHQIKSEKLKIRRKKLEKNDDVWTKEQIKEIKVPQEKVQIKIKNNPQCTSFTELEIIQINTKVDQGYEIVRKWQIQKAKQVSILKLQEELQQLSDKISQQANQFHDRRIIAFQRIQYLLAFYHIPIKLFGSCANGIAIRNSDIDIAIDSFILNWMQFLPENQRIKAALQKLQQLFCTQSWIKQLKVIKTAAIPVIKMTINTQIPFLDPSIGDTYYQLNRSHFSGQINADITIQTINQCHQSCHLGIISTNAINSWIKQISSLHSIIIVMKYFFSKNNLNCTYEGGLNTFSMIVLFVAFIYHEKLEQQQNAAVVLEKILRFYAYEFDEKQTGIDILKRSQNGIYFIKNSSFNNDFSPKANKDKADLQIRDPMNQHKNMTRNCYSFYKIKSLFELILKNCFEKRQKQIDKIFIQRQIEQQGKQDSFLDLVRQNLKQKNIFCYVINQIDQFF